MRIINTNHHKLLFTLLLTGIVALVAGCGGREIPATSTVPTIPVSTASSISLSTSATMVKSDGTDSISITATALDTNNAALPAQVLLISSTGGQLNTSTVTTDATGKAVFTFSGGSSGFNSTPIITVTASGSAATKSLPIMISGSSLTLSALSATVAAGTPLDITVNAKDAGGKGISAQSLRYSIAPSSGSGTLDTSTGITNSLGTSVVKLTGTAAGNVDVLVEWLDATNTVTARATKTIAITAAGGAFMVTTPATSPFAATIGTNQNVTVNVPASISGKPIAFLRYATTLGSWLGNNSKVLTVANTGASNTQAFVPGLSAGNASIQIDALEASGAVITSASFIFSISSSSANASSITLQSNVSVLPPSVGTNLSTTTFTAVVKDVALNPVGGANILFELVSSTGTGESISPVVVTTNSSDPAIPLGQAQATFTAGTSPTTQGAAVKATVIGTTVSATAPITVGGQATSVSLGASTTISAINSNTAYSLPVTVIVSDSSGARVSGAVVSLSLWPVGYWKGYRGLPVGAPSGTTYKVCQANHVGSRFKNEDINSSLTLDSGEDIDGPGGLIITASTATAVAGLTDGVLWPAPSTAGAIPATVTTGADGTATFDWVYLKQYAQWVDARIRATLQVQGSQSSTEIILPLTASVADIEATSCSLPNSPFN